MNIELLINRCVAIIWLLSALLCFGIAESFAAVAPIISNRGGAQTGGGPVTLLNGQVESTGGESPEVVVFYGLTDGGTNITEWAESVSAGVKGEGSFFVGAVNLQDGSNYFYRCFAMNSAGESWASNSTEFTASLYLSEEDTLALETASRQDLVTSIREQGGQTMALGALEQLAFDQSNVVISSWADWCSVYSGVELTPCLEFNVFDPVTNMPSSVTNVFMRWMHAFWTHDSSTLFDLSDADVLEEWGYSVTNPAAGAELYWTNSSQVALLFTGKTVLDSEEYQAFYYRRFAPVNPKSERVVYSLRVFRKEGNGYRMTGDMGETKLEQGWAAGGVAWIPIGFYSNMWEVMTSTEFPSSFYTID